MKKIVLFLICLWISNLMFGQSNKAMNLVDGMQKKYKSLGSFSANFSFQTDGGSVMTGTISVKGLKYRLKTAGQEIFNNGKEVATYIKEINEVNLASFDPSEGDLNPAKIYSFDKKSYKASFLSESGGIAAIELVPISKSTQVTKLILKMGTSDFTVREWTILNKTGKKQNFKVTKFNAKEAIDEKYFNFDRKAFPGVEINDLR